MMVASNKALLVWFFFFLFLGCQPGVFAEKKPYIVYLGGHSHGPEINLNDLDRVTNSHHDLLASILGSQEVAKEAIIYSYKRNINGFAATLEEEDAEKIATHPEVISVFENKGRNLHTTHSWNFMNLEDFNGEVLTDSLWSRSNFGKDTIIATIDSGVWPESESFHDHGFGPIPSKWRGSCQNSSIVPCNKKLIGARYYNKAYLEETRANLSHDMNSPRDHEGHGTHTLSTAGGNFVTNTTIFGVPLGTIKGGSPAARVASYKVCWPLVQGFNGTCFDGDILAAFDQAIHDGADVISLSLGGDPEDYFEDAIAIGAFHALQKNIVVVASGGNSGPVPGTVSNLAPWLLTVAASTLDRRFQSAVQLPNGILLKGVSLSRALPVKKFYPMIYAGLAGNANSSVRDAERCFLDTLDPEKVKGKILVCLRGKSDRVEKGYVAAQAGAVGMILCNNAVFGDRITADPHFLPAIQISYQDSLLLYSYMNSTK
ncbi:OLC1v1023770C1 [Oldenlandia corymbosa var. corymbosa]|nr:OLC1v1023770C1 [Oldenlandia corymbosa var. corymbosa]